MDWKDCPTVEINPQKVSGAPVVKGTRVQADAIVENYESGSDVEEIHENFPSVSVAKIREAKAASRASGAIPSISIRLKSSSNATAFGFGRKNSFAERIHSAQNTLAGPCVGELRQISLRNVVMLAGNLLRPALHWRFHYREAAARRSRPGNDSAPFGQDGLANLLRCLVDLERFELSTSSMPWKRAPNCATGPRA